jgi:hypothetical protein
MTQTPELSRHVDLRAVSARLNRTLQPQGIKAAVVYQVNRLQIALEGLDAPDRQRLTQQVVQMVRELRVPIKTIEVSGYRTGEPKAIWQQHLRVSDGQVMTNVVPIAAPPKESGVGLRPTGGHRLANPTPARSPAPDRWQQKPEAEIIAAAQRGDISAIRSFVRLNLADYTIVSDATQLQHGVVKLTIESTQYLGGPAFAHEIAALMLPLYSAKVQELEIYKRKFEGATPFLIQKLSLAPQVVEEDVPPITPHSIPAECPIGIKLIAGLFVVIGLLHLAIALAMGITLYFFTTAANKLPNVSIMFPYLGSTLLLSIAVAAGSGLVAIGLWQRQRWGQLLSYILTGLMLFRGGQMLIDTWGTETLIVPIIPLEIGVMALLIGMLIYLTRRSVTCQFR